MVDVATTLRGTDLLGRLSDEQIASVVERSETARFAPGQAIVRAGEVGDVGCWVILDGRAEVRVGKSVVAHFGSGDHFGEMALFAEQPAPRSADVVATRDTLALKLTREEFRRLIGSSPDLAMVLLAEMSDRLRNTNEQLSRLSTAFDETDHEGLAALQVSRDDYGFLGPTLGTLGQRRVVRVGGVRFIGRRRRPSGEKAPLPRELQASGIFWLVAGITVVLTWISLFAWPETTNWWTDRDLSVLRWLEDLRTATATTVMKALHALGSAWAIRPLRWATVLVLVVYKRWRHLFAGLVAFAVVHEISAGLADAVGRPRPFVEIIGSWSGYSHPSIPVARLSITLAVIGFALIPRGRWRNWWFVLSSVAVAALAAARMYLGVDHPTDAVMAALLGIAVGVLVYRLWVPDAVFPVSYRMHRAAHLDVSGQRGRAIRQALTDQLGLHVLEIEPFGLAGSGGSTPLRVRVAGDPDRNLFAKLYSRTHLRSDRWYKLGRTILYGSLEDEVRFTSVRRLVEYEDYLLRVMKSAGLPSAEPYGIVEITPEREYLIVTEFLQGAEELGEAEVDDGIIDEALQMIRKMWDAGLAHRDIKPANVLVRDGRVYLIDVAFATVRPTPWRQAVDLANMMMILGLRAEPERVYERALRYFVREDIAEAFAATHGITIPTQSRGALAERRKADGVDLIEEFRKLAGDREPISIQRWGARRIGLTAGAVMVGLLFLGVFVDNITGAGFI